MKLAEIEQPFREGLATWEAFRRLGFSADDIYAGAALHPDLLSECFAIVLRTGTREFVVTIACKGKGSIDAAGGYDAAMSRWQTIAEAVARGDVAESDLSELWATSEVAPKLSLLASAVRAKGITIPGKN